MTSAAAVLFAAGAALLFAPGELLRLYGASVSPVGLHVAQLLGAALLGFGALDWLARGMVLGGIYGRPVVAANMAQSGISALVLLRAVMDEPANPALWVTMLVTGTFASAFAWLLLRGGVPAADRLPS